MRNLQLKTIQLVHNFSLFDAYASKAHMQKTVWEVNKHLGRESTQGQLHFYSKAPNATDRREHPDWVRCTLQAKWKGQWEKKTLLHHI